MSAQRSRLARELRDLRDLWLAPFAVALLPYRLGLKLAHWLARSVPLYEEAARSGLEQWRLVRSDVDERPWLADYRFAQLVDHADLYWALTRSDAFLLRRLQTLPLDVPRDRPLLVLSYHFGQGLWLIRWLRARGIAARFVSVPSSPEWADSWLMFFYGRLRMRVVERLAGIAPIFLGGARSHIGEVLREGGAIYGLIDVPMRTAGSQSSNCTLFSRSVALPSGLIDSAKAANAAVLVITSRMGTDGDRILEAQLSGNPAELTMQRVAEELEARVERAPAAWHLWHRLPAFVAQPAER
ncbi:MAG TPA: hypothetical protein VNE58_09470 [Casimicrobiaceae bacterium]|nr:hypothetical protein [Casimicrobiaceae bacterium]